MNIVRFVLDQADTWWREKVFKCEDAVSGKSGNKDLPNWIPRKDHRSRSKHRTRIGNSSNKLDKEALNGICTCTSQDQCHSLLSELVVVNIDNNFCRIGNLLLSYTALGETLHGNSLKREITKLHRRHKSFDMFQSKVQELLDEYSWSEARIDFREIKNDENLIERIMQSDHVKMRIHSRLRKIAACQGQDDIDKLKMAKFERFVFYQDIQAVDECIGRLNSKSKFSQMGLNDYAGFTSIKRSLSRDSIKFIKLMEATDRIAAEWTKDGNEDVVQSVQDFRNVAEAIKASKKTDSILNSQEGVDEFIDQFDSKLIEIESMNVTTKLNWSSTLSMVYHWYKHAKNKTAHEYFSLADEIFLEENCIDVSVSQDGQSYKKTYSAAIKDGDKECLYLGFTWSIEQKENIYTDIILSYF